MVQREFQYCTSAEELAERVRSYNPNSDSELITSAYLYSQEMHAPQLRRSGEPYFTHPRAVASILADQRLDDTTIATALLHDTLEDTRSTEKELTARFGAAIAGLVDGVTKLTNITTVSVETKEAENFRKLLLAVSKDPRVIVVKLADRLHNMKTIKHLPGEKRTRKARETMEVYAPLAGRMGMQWMREELENLAFREMDPLEHKALLLRFAKMRREHPHLMEEIISDIRDELERVGVKAEVEGRAKKPYSAWRKLKEEKRDFSALSDVLGFRVITSSADDIYKALGAIHLKWKAVPGRFKDYVSHPKSNGYRSVHTVISGKYGHIVEIQIRTRDMHLEAEIGVAAHWSYRDGQRVELKNSEDPGYWIRNLTENFGEEPDESLVELVKLEMYSDQVFCFTPKGRVIRLPKGATPVDFAYMVHTDVGMTCAGAKVDGKRVPLFNRLKNGQTVEILTAANQRPNANWEDMAVTGRAKSAIRRAVKTERIESDVRLGRELARVTLERVNKRLTDKALSTAATALGVRNAQQLLAKMGRMEITGGKLIKVLYPELVEAAEKKVQTACKISGLPEGQSRLRTFCCRPLPGERIVGISQRGNGVKVHVIHCEKLAKYENQPERWIDLRWTEGKSNRNHKAYLDVTMANSAGVLGRVCTLFGEQNSNISDLKFTDRKPDLYRMEFEVEVRDVEHLCNIQRALDAESDVVVHKRIHGRTPKPKTPVARRA